MALRLDISKTLKGFQKLKDNLLPLNVDVIGHYYYLKKELKDSDVRYMKKNPGFKEIKEKLLKDVAVIWEKANVPMISEQRIQAKLKDLINKYEAARKYEINRVKKLMKSG